MAEKLDAKSIRAWLKERSGWKLKQDAMVKDFAFPTFRDAIVFLNRVATIADTSDHHPDIDIRYTQIRILLTTHDAGGLTEKDLTVAEEIDFAFPRRPTR